ncbi:MAG: high-affinity nickel-transporter [Candidatus Rokuibacteriota bacterium]|nr:MAG: high-affinity nickel-transporter [Candidatus Rokubacteria bacterium]
MRRPALLLGLLALLAAALVAPSGAAAHPLGNFTINRFSRIEASGHRIYVRYVLDMAEIPTFQARQSGGIDAASYSRRIARDADLRIDGRSARLVPLAHALAFPQGAGGLQTTRLEVILRGPRLTAPTRIAYRDTNYAGRLGWKEIVVGATAPSRSDELRAYPKDLLQSPLDVTSVTTTLAPTGGPDVPPALTRGPALQAPDRIADSGFASLITKSRLSVGFVLLSLGIAFFWGAAHALSPGHGKSIVAAYLVGARGTPRHALLLGLTVTITHTIGVFALGLVTLSLSEFVVPDRLYPWLNLVSALLVVAVGISVLRWRIREWRRGPAHDHENHHHHDHHHHHAHGQAHHHADDPALRFKRLLGVGVSGGIIPCPTALVVLLAAISLHRVGYGLVLILAFSLGLAAAMSSVGLLAVTAKRVFARVSFERGLVRLLPAVSAIVVLGLGLAMTVRALPKVS